MIIRAKDLTRVAGDGTVTYTVALTQLQTRPWYPMYVTLVLGDGERQMRLTHIETEPEQALYVVERSTDTSLTLAITNDTKERRRV